MWSDRPRWIVPVVAQIRATQDGAAGSILTLCLPPFTLSPKAAVQ